MGLFEKKIFFIACHDAGGAEIISSWLKKKKIKFFGTITGPAKNIFKRKNLKFINRKNLSEIKKIDLVLAGSGWTSKNEVKAIITAKKFKKKSICFLDHWRNYKSRFYYKKKYHYPDEIWVGDKYAKKEAKKNFKRIKIKLINNPYWDFLKKNKVKNKIQTNKKILIATNNFDEGKFLFKKKLKITDLQYLNKTVNYVKKNFKTKNIFLKIHPSEKKEKYKQIIKKHKYSKIKIETEIDIIKLLSKYTSLIACETNLLPLAKIMGLNTLNLFINNKNFRVVPKPYFDKYLYI